MVTEVLRALHGDFENYPSKLETLIANREKKYYQMRAHLIRKWVTSCEQCIKESKIDNRLIHLTFKNSIEPVTGPEKAFKVDLVPTKHLYPVAVKI